MSKRFIDKYEIVSTLGRGSMGVVYKGRDPEIGRLVAIKTLKSVFLGDDPAGNEAMQRFRQESRSAGKLHHANIVTIFEAGKTESGSPYIVMEYIDGHSLESMLADRGPLPVLEVLHYLAQMGGAIDYAHSQNVIHRDIKPSNIIVDDKFRPHLLDFGVAKLSDTSLTPAGTVVGTPSYMSPEQIRGATLDGRTDLFSLGVVAYELFTGVRPFPGNDFTTVVSNIIHKPPLPFRESKSSLPKELEEVLFKSVAKTREERFDSVLQFVDAMAQAFSVVIDGSGIVGGFDPSLKLEEAAARSNSIASTAPVAKPLVAQTNPPPSSTSAKLVNGASTNGRNLTGSMTAPITGVESPDDAVATITMPKAESLSSISQKATRRSPQEGLGLKAAAVFATILVVLIAGIFWTLNRPASDQETIVVIPVDAVPAAVAVTNGSNIGLEPGNTTPASIENNTANSPLVGTAIEAPPMGAPPMGVPPVGTPPAEGITSQYLASLSPADLGRLLAEKQLDAASLRVLIAEASGKMNPEVIAGMVAALNHPKFLVRVDVLKSLGNSSQLRESLVVDAVIARLDDQDELVRGFAAKTLIAVKSPAALEALERRLANEPSAMVQKVIQQSIKEKAN